MKPYTDLDYLLGRPKLPGQSWQQDVAISPADVVKLLEWTTGPLYEARKRSERSKGGRAPKYAKARSWQWRSASCDEPAT